MYRFLLRPKWIILHVVVLALVVTMINLGLWQLRRLGERQDFNQPTSKDWCLAYGRDRGEKDQEAITTHTVARLLGELGQEYDYLWFDGRWHVRFHATGDRFVTLDEARNLEEVEG